MCYRSYFVQTGLLWAQKVWKPLVQFTTDVFSTNNMLNFFTVAYYITYLFHIMKPALHLAVWCTSMWGRWLHSWFWLSSLCWVEVLWNVAHKTQTFSLANLCEKMFCVWDCPVSLSTQGYISSSFNRRRCKQW